MNQGVNSFAGLFKTCCIRYIRFIKCNVNNIYDMSYMFYNCKSLEEVDFNNFKSYKVKYMNHMFFGCESLIYVDINDLNANNVTSMSDMF